MSKRKSHDPVWLKAHGYDGLFADTGDDLNCGCGVDDFAPCGEGPFPECVPAILRESNDRGALFYPARKAKSA